MAIALIITGLILWLTIAPAVGWVCLVIGLVLFLIEAVGHHSFVGRRRPPPPPL